MPFQQLYMPARKERCGVHAAPRRAAEENVDAEDGCKTGQ